MRRDTDEQPPTCLRWLRNKVSEQGSLCGGEGWVELRLVGVNDGNEEEEKEEEEEEEEEEEDEEEEEKEVEVEVEVEVEQKGRSIGE